MDKNDILKIGLWVEISANKFYKSGAELVSNPGARQMLLELAEEEERHIKLFEDALAGQEVGFGEGAPAQGQDLKIGETTEAPMINADSTPEEILLVAIKAEMRTITFYSESAREFAGTLVGEMLLGLVKEEQIHKARLELLYDDEYLQEN